MTLVTTAILGVTIITSSFISGVFGMAGGMVLLGVLLAGGVTSVATALAAAHLFGLDAALIGGLYAKSVTAPIAMGIAERIHVSPTLTAVYALSTGILGAILGRFVMDALRMRQVVSSNDTMPSACTSRFCKS